MRMLTQIFLIILIFERRLIRKLSNTHTTEILIAKTKEGERILKHISPKDHLVSFDLSKKEMDSVLFASFIQKKCDLYNGHLVFVIGGSYGLSDNIKRLANLRLGFSKMTFPHQLFRVMLLEQIYRATTITNNILYHK